VINRFGAIGGAYVPPSGGSHGFIYRDGVFTDIGTLGGVYSDLEDLNDKGFAVGKSLVAGNIDFHPYLYERGTMKDLGTFGGRFGTALAVNSHGVVVGAASDAANLVHAFVYDGGPIRPLFPGETGNSQAVDINDHGTIIGWRQGAGSSFIYDDGVVTMIEQIPEVKAQGWFWLTPTGINDRGWITGYGRKAGVSSEIGFVLMPK
jgi:probable HAF family extracellular repeat protein